jgi:hypothetical protein
VESNEFGELLQGGGMRVEIKTDQGIKTVDFERPPTEADIDEIAGKFRVKKPAPQFANPGVKPVAASKPVSAESKPVASKAPSGSSRGASVGAGIGAGAQSPRKAWIPNEYLYDELTRVIEEQRAPQKVKRPSAAPQGRQADTKRIIKADEPTPTNTVNDLLFGVTAAKERKAKQDIFLRRHYTAPPKPENPNDTKAILSKMVDVGRKRQATAPLTFWNGKWWGGDPFENQQFTRQALEWALDHDSGVVGLKGGKGEMDLREALASLSRATGGVVVFRDPGHSRAQVEQMDENAAYTNFGTAGLGYTYGFSNEAAKAGVYNPHSGKMEKSTSGRARAAVNQSQKNLSDWISSKLGLEKDNFVSSFASEIAMFLPNLTAELYTTLDPDENVETRAKALVNLVGGLATTTPGAKVVASGVRSLLATKYLAPVAQAIAKAVPAGLSKAEAVAKFSRRFDTSISKADSILKVLTNGTYNTSEGALRALHDLSEGELSAVKTKLPTVPRNRMSLVDDEAGAGTVMAGGLSGESQKGARAASQNAVKGSLKSVPNEVTGQLVLEHSHFLQKWEALANKSRQQLKEIKREEAGRLNMMIVPPSALAVAYHSTIIASYHLVKAGFSIAKATGPLMAELKITKKRAQDILGQQLLIFGEDVKKYARLTVGDAKAQAIVAKMMHLMPDSDEYRQAALAGLSKRGWFRRSNELFETLFQADAPVFIKLLSATSPRQTVQENLKMAIRVYGEWVKRGRPTDEAAIRAMFRPVSPGSNVYQLVNIRGRVGGSVSAFLDPHGPLNGFKVDSFVENLRGNHSRVTNDTWMAQFAEMPQSRFGTKRGYEAGELKLKKAAHDLTEMTGEEWTPAEVQETLWSFYKHLSEAAKRGERPVDVIKRLTHEEIEAGDDFITAFKSPEVQQLLRQTGISEERIQAGHMLKHAPSGLKGRVIDSPLADPTTLVRIAERTERRLGRQRIVERIESGLGVTPADQQRYFLNDLDIAKLKQAVSRLQGLKRTTRIHSIFDKALERTRGRAYEQEHRLRADESREKLRSIRGPLTMRPRTVRTDGFSQQSIFHKAPLRVPGPPTLRAMTYAA